MVARRRTSSPDCDQQPRSTRAQFAQPPVSGLGKEGGARFDPRFDQTARGRSVRNAGFIFRKFAGSFGAGPAGACRAPSDYAGAWGGGGRQRGGGSLAANVLL